MQSCVSKKKIFPTKKKLVSNQTKKKPKNNLERQRPSTLKSMYYTLNKKT